MKNCFIFLPVLPIFFETERPPKQEQSQFTVLIF